MKYVTMMMAVGLVALLGACGHAYDNGDNYSYSSRSLTYELTENGCSTGSHTFSSERELCEGLSSASLNNAPFCAPSLRKSAYEARCTGFFTQTP